MSTNVTAEFTVDHLHRILGFEMSEEQLAAVTADLAQPLLVVAGAGSGKTTVMAARVLWAVATGQVRPEQIVGLTFTRKAAGELGARVRHLLDVLFEDYPPRSLTDVDTGTPTVSTYHSFAHQFVAEHGLRIGVEPGARLLSETESLQIAYRVLLNTALPLTDMGVAAPTLTEAVVKLDQQLSEHICTTAQLRAHEHAILERIDSLPKTVADDRKLRDVCARRLQLCDVVEEFRAEKAQQAVVDFADVLRLGHELAARQDVQEIFHSQVKMVLLDEYQDTSVVQSELLAPLIGPTNSVTAVGDPLQAIYGWRGAGANAMADFSKHFAAVPGSNAQRAINVLPLSISQRSGPNVLAVANDIAAPLRRDSGSGESAQVVTLRSGVGRDGLPRRDGVRAAVFETYAQEVRWLGDRIAEQVDAGTEPSEIAVLCRARSDFAPVLDELRARGIPAVVSGSEGLLAQPEVIDVISMLEVANDPTSNPATLRILLGPRVRLGPRDLALLGRLASELARKDGLPTPEPDVRAEVDFTESIRGIDRADLVSLAEAIDALADHPDHPISAEGRARIERLAVELRSTREAIGLPLSDLVSRVIALIGLDVEARLEAMMATSNKSTLAQRGIAALQALHELVSTAQESADGASLAGFLSWISVMQRVKREPEFDVPIPTDAVSIMTVHKSKGLEWEVVAVPFLSETVFPNGRAPDRWTSNVRELPHVLRGDRDSLPELNGFGTNAYKEFNEELAELNGGEERRLGYVAVTRPTRLLLASGHWWGPTQSRKRGASYLLRAVRDNYADPSDTDEWVAETVHEQNPQTASTPVVTWPPNLGTPTRDRRLVAAAQVDAAIDALRAAQYESTDGEASAGRDSDPGVTDARPFGADRLEEGPPEVEISGVDSVRISDGDAAMTDSERVLVEDWDHDIELLLNERRERGKLRTADLPRTLSASDFMAVTSDAADFQSRRARPMPRKPSAAAARGTRFHTWVEEHLGARPMFEELPGAVDDELFTDEELVDLRHGFLRTEYADLTPYAVEVPFSVVVNGLVLKGRIDAVYQRDGRWEMVDWKTNRSPNADPVQLAVYRYAWSQMLNIPVTEIDGVFVYVRTADVVRYDDLPDVPELIAAASG